jgi:hypothetical protein
VLKLWLKNFSENFSHDPVGGHHQTCWHDGARLQRDGLPAHRLRHFGTLEANTASEHLRCGLTWADALGEAPPVAARMVPERR